MEEGEQRIEVGSRDRAAKRATGQPREDLFRTGELCFFSGVGRSADEELPPARRVSGIGGSWVRLHVERSIDADGPEGRFFLRGDG